ncbi:putative oxidoreductase YhhX [compost metagenome]
MRDWGFGIIGCGSIAGFHRAAIHSLDNARLVGVASRSGARAKAFALESGHCECWSDYRQLLEHPGIDIVCVTTESGSHFQVGQQVLLAGKHAIIEKPLAMKAEEARRLTGLAADRGLSLSVVSQRRFEPQVAAIKRAVDAGKLGRLLYIEAGTPYYRTQEYYDQSEWRGTFAMDGGALMNQGIHQIDLMLWMAGPVSSVYGQVATLAHRMEAEDTGTAIVRFVNGAIGTIMASTSMKPGFPPYLHLYGEKGSVKLSGSSIVQWSVEGEPSPSPVFESSLETDGSSNPLDISPMHHKRQFEALLQALDQGNDPPVSGGEGALAVELIEAIYASSASGKEIALLSTSYTRGDTHAD